jgi:hypothetical protein
VTAGAVLAERDLIRERRGKSTIDVSAAEVLANPDDYPSLRAFGPADADEAILIATKDAIRKAYKSLVIEIERRADQPPTEIRVLHAPPDEDGERDYRTIAEIKENPKDLPRLVADLRKEARSYAQKVESVLAEVELAL